MGDLSAEVKIFRFVIDDVIWPEFSITSQMTDVFFSLKSRPLVIKLTCYFTFPCFSLYIIVNDVFIDISFFFKQTCLLHWWLYFWIPNWVDHTFQSNKDEYGYKIWNSCLLNLSKPGYFVFLIQNFIIPCISKV